MTGLDGPKQGKASARRGQDRGRMGNTGQVRRMLGAWAENEKLGSAKLNSKDLSAVGKMGSRRAESRLKRGREHAQKGSKNAAVPCSFGLLGSTASQADAGRMECKREA